MFSQIKHNIKLVEVLASIDDSNLFTEQLEESFISNGIDIQLLIENRIDWLRNNMFDKLEPIASKSNKTTDELFDYLVSLDPSKKKTYAQWIFNLIIKGINKLDELTDIPNLITKYEELKKENSLSPEYKNFTSLKSVKELKDAVMSTTKEIEKKADSVEQKARDESEIYYEDSIWLVLRPKTEAAAGYFGRETLWCTAAGYGRQADRTNNMFSTYATDLITIYNKKTPDKSYQLSVIKNQFMDGENEYIDSNTANKILRSLPVVGVRIIFHQETNDTPYNNFIRKYDLEDILHDIEFNYYDGYNLDTITPIDAFAILKKKYERKGDSDALEEVISTSVEYSHEYAAYVLEDRFELGEEAIATSAKYSYLYAWIALKGERFELGEEVISQDSNYSYLYAANVLEGEFKLGEKAIATDAEYSYLYAVNILEGEFKLGEKAIATNFIHSYRYAMNVLKGERFELGEPIIATDLRYSYEYAKEVLKGRFELGEDKISKSDEASYKYARYILKGERFELGEEAIATNAAYSYMYATEVLKDRFPLGEPTIMDSGYEGRYMKEFNITEW